MTDKDFRRIVMALDGAVEGAHMGHPDFRAHGRIFATLRWESAAKPTRSAPRMFGVIMLTPEQQQQFVEASDAFTPESGAWGRGGSTRVRIEDVDAEMLGDALTLAWQNAVATAAKRKVAAKRTSRGTNTAVTPQRAAATKRKVVRR